MLDDLDFGAAYGFAGVGLFAALDEGNDTVLSGVDGVVAAHHSAFASKLRHTNLAEDDFAGLYFLAAAALKTKPLAGTVFDIFRGTARFDV